jgi:hypothetical protein
VLALEVGSSRTLDKECLNHASNLRSTQETWERETQEDKLAVTERNTLLGSVQTLIPSLRAFVQYHLTDHPEPARVLSDFAFSSPSELRTEKAALEALSDVLRALNTHKGALKSGAARISTWETRIQNYSSRLRTISQERIREQSETNDARDKREQARSAALKFLRQLQLLSLALQMENPTLLKDWDQTLALIEKSL